MNVEQTPIEQVTQKEKVESPEQKPVISSHMRKGSQEWRSYVPHDKVAECRYRLSLIESRVLSSNQQQVKEV